MSSSKAIRKFERLLFKGIPEHPEQYYERDQNSSVALRVTGRSQNNNVDSSGDNRNVIGYISYDFENHTEKFVRNDEFACNHTSEV